MFRRFQKWWSSRHVMEQAEPPRPTETPEVGPSYAADQPIDSKLQDRLARWPFAQRLAQTIAHRTDPNSLVVGIYGVWGDGKTSVLRMMQGASLATGRVTIVR